MPTWVEVIVGFRRKIGFINGARYWRTFALGKASTRCRDSCATETERVCCHRRSAVYRTFVLAAVVARFKFDLSGYGLTNPLPGVQI